MATKLYVGNLPFSADESAVRSLFEQNERKVEEVKLITDRETGRPRAFGFVEMGSNEDADQASDYEAKDELEMRRELMADAMGVLNEREQDILTQRRLMDSPVTLEELSGQYGVSRERIRQIEVRAFEKLQKKMQELAREKGMLESA